MEDSKLLLGSRAPVTPRPAHGFPIGRKGVCRALWPVDHDRNKSELRRINEMLEERDRIKWNFDFQNGTPCTGGRFEWEKIDSENSEDIPQAYSLPQLDAKSAFSTPVKFVGLSSRSRCSSPALSSTNRSDSPLPLGEVTNSPLTVLGRASSPFLAIPRPTTPSNTTTEVPSTSSTSSSSPSTSAQPSRKRKNECTQTTIPEYFSCKKPRVSAATKS